MARIIPARVRPEDRSKELSPLCFSFCLLETCEFLFKMFIREQSVEFSCSLSVFARNLTGTDTFLPVRTLLMYLVVRTLLIDSLLTRTLLMYLVVRPLLMYLVEYVL